MLLYYGISTQQLIYTDSIQILSCVAVSIERIVTHPLMC